MKPTAELLARALLGDAAAFTELGLKLTERRIETLEERSGGWFPGAAAGAVRNGPGGPTFQDGPEGDCFLCGRTFDRLDGLLCEDCAEREFNR